jgi:broad specificity phosphatase PhoE
MTARLVLARHGRTAGNVVKALDSKPPGLPLDEVGRAQAADLGRRLAAEPVTAVYASQALRAQQTAEPVAAGHGVAVEVIDGVQEVFCGDLEGNTDHASREHFERVYQAWLRGELDAHLPGGESALDLRARFVPAVDAITAGASGAVVVVSHGAAIRLGVGALLGETAETRYVPNAGVVVLVGGPGGWELEQWDGAEPVAGDVTGGGGEPGGEPGREPGW